MHTSVWFPKTSHGMCTLMHLEHVRTIVHTHMYIYIMLVHRHVEMVQLWLQKRKENLEMGQLQSVMVKVRGPYYIERTYIVTYYVLL
jgi:hypothetical protein